MYNLFEWLIIGSSVITLLMALVLLATFVLRRERAVGSVELPAVTVFVPFYNEDKTSIIRTLESLSLQDYPTTLQILVIDDGSTNDTPAEVKQWIEVNKQYGFHLLHKKQNDGRKGYALDYALASKIATGDIYVVVDSDTCVNRDGIRELVSKMASDDRYAAVCGFIAPENSEDNMLSKLQHYEHIGHYGAIRCAQDKLGLVPVLAGAFVAHRASVVKEIGGWSEWLVEDIAWCWRAIAHNYRTGYAPKAIANTQCPTTHLGLFKQRRRWARGRVEAYMAAWNVSKTSGLVSTPWFAITSLQYMFPPAILLVPVLISMGLYLPIGLGLATYMVYFRFYHLFQRRYPYHSEKAQGGIVTITLATLVLECIVWVPNVLGYFDEIIGRRKDWLTR